MKISEQEECIGRHTFDKDRITLEMQEEGVRDNRNLFINFCNINGSIAANTFYQKLDRFLLTHRHANAELGPPWTRGRYETVDYIVVNKKWRNTIQDVGADIMSNLPTDHAPLIIKTETKLKATVRESRRKGKNMKNVRWHKGTT